MEADGGVAGDGVAVVRNGRERGASWGGSGDAGEAREGVDKAERERGAVGRW